MTLKELLDKIEPYERKNLKYTIDYLDDENLWDYSWEYNFNSYEKILEHVEHDTSFLEKKVVKFRHYIQDYHLVMQIDITK